MNKNYRYIIISIIAVIIFYNLYSSFTTGGIENYEKEIKAAREESDRFMRSPKSPFENPADYKGLNYFPINPDFRIPARLEYIPGPTYMEVGTSQGEEKSYIKYAWANFTYLKKEYRVLLLKEKASEPQLFLAFADATSGKETYGGGRYLNVDYHKSAKSIILDFNRAYHPYCVFNKKYVCPLPPKENLLDFKIEAGEKL